MVEHGQRVGCLLIGPVGGGVGPAALPAAAEIQRHDRAVRRQQWRDDLEVAAVARQTGQTDDRGQGRRRAGIVARVDPHAIGCCDEMFGKLHGRDQSQPPRRPVSDVFEQGSAAGAAAGSPASAGTEVEATLRLSVRAPRIRSAVIGRTVLGASRER